MIIKMNIPIHL